MFGVATAILVAIAVQAAEPPQSAEQLPVAAAEIRQSLVQGPAAPPALAEVSRSLRGALAPATVVRRQAGGPSWTPIVLGGFMANGGAGVAVGGGVRGSNIMGNEDYAFQVDVLWSNADYCSSCGSTGFGSTDFSGSQLAFSGAFLWLFGDSGATWRPHVGGGIVFTRWSISASSDIGFPFEVSTSGTSGGLQVQGGMSNDRIVVEVRAQSVLGGGVAALVGFKFGGS